MYKQLDVTHHKFTFILKISIYKETHLKHVYWKSKNTDWIVPIEQMKNSLKVLHHVSSWGQESSETYNQLLESHLGDIQIQISKNLLASRISSGVLLLNTVSSCAGQPSTDPIFLSRFYPESMAQIILSWILTL